MTTNSTSEHLACRSRRMSSARSFSAAGTGEPERSLCRHFGISLKELRAHIDKHCPAIDRAAARRALGLICNALMLCLKPFTLRHWLATCSAPTVA